MSNTFERVSTWNTLCGKDAEVIGTPEYFASLVNQGKRIQEELDEYFLAVDACQRLANTDNGQTIQIKGESVTVDDDLREHWMVEILDAGCDLDVTVAGANYLAGHQYGDAIGRVLSNNDEKYTYDRTKAEAALLKLGSSTHRIVEVPVRIDIHECDDPEVVKDKEKMAELGYDTVELYGAICVYVYSVHRNEDDKICKLLNHPKVDMSDLIN